MPAEADAARALEGLEVDRRARRARLRARRLLHRRRELRRLRRPRLRRTLLWRPRLRRPHGLEWLGSGWWRLRWYTAGRLPRPALPSAAPEQPAVTPVALAPIRHDEWRHGQGEREGDEQQRRAALERMRAHRTRTLPSNPIARARAPTVAPARGAFAKASDAPGAISDLPCSKTNRRNSMTYSCPRVTLSLFGRCLFAATTGLLLRDFLTDY